MSHFSQTKSYKCNKKHAEELAQCENASKRAVKRASETAVEPTSPRAVDADIRRLAKKKKSSDEDESDESGDEVEPSEVDKCKSNAADNYNECCSTHAGGRCSYPCTETCMQQHGTITKEFKRCCKRCPGVRAWTRGACWKRSA